jgi:hypothetical protein
MRRRAWFAVGALVVAATAFVGYKQWTAYRCRWTMGWVKDVPQPGTYALTVRCTAPAGPVALTANLDGRDVAAQVPQTSGEPLALNLGTWRLKRAGAHTVQLRYSPVPPLNVQSVDLVPCGTP